MCRPRDDIVTEKQAIHDDYDPDMENEEEQGEANRCGSGNCMCKKSPKDFPEWKWLITRKGYAMVVHLQVESEKRDQDMMGQYHYNDFSGYGFQEVVENHVSAANRLTSLPHFCVILITDEPRACLIQQGIFEENPEC